MPVLWVFETDLVLLLERDAALQCRVVCPAPTTAVLIEEQVIGGSLHLMLQKLRHCRECIHGERCNYLLYKTQLVLYN